MNRKQMAVFLAAGLSLALTGCTTRAWYDGLQERQRQDCYRYESRDEVQRCLDSVNSVSYDEYKREREKSE